MREVPLQKCPAVSDPETIEPRSRWFRLPRPLWIGLVTIGVLGAAVGLKIGVPIYRQQIAIKTIQGRGGDFTTNEWVPAWLRQIAGEQWTDVVEPITEIAMGGTHVTDQDMVVLSALSKANERPCRSVYPRPLAR